MVADATGLRRHVETRATQLHVVACAEMKTAYRRAAPYKSGDTQESVDVVSFRGSPSERIATAQATTPQALYTDQGTRPHTIRPRRAKVLRFRIGARVVFAREVHHPGTPATRWFSNTGPREWHQALIRATARVR